MRRQLHRAHRLRAERRRVRAVPRRHARARCWCSQLLCPLIRQVLPLCSRVRVIVCAYMHLCICMYVNGAVTCWGVWPMRWSNCSLVAVCCRSLRCNFVRQSDAIRDLVRYSDVHEVRPAAGVTHVLQCIACIHIYVNVHMQGIYMYLYIHI